MPPTADYQELTDLLTLLCDGQFVQRDLERLERLLLNDPEAQRYYARFLALDEELAWSIAGPSNPAIVALSPSIPTNDLDDDASLEDAASTKRPSRAIPAPTDLRESMPLPFSVPVDQGAAHGISGYFASGWPVAYLVATVIFAIGLAIGAIIHVSRPAQFVGPGASPTRNSQSPIPSPSSVVARITGMADCEWEGSGFRVQGSGPANHQSEITNHQSVLHLGDRLALKSGLLELTYDTGARVLLQGPVTYEVESPAGGFLSLGKLTAKLEKRSAVSGQRSESANQKSSDLCPLTSDLFAIRTPTAIVTDLGTEFGVEVDEQGDMQTHVFAGKVKIAAKGQSEETASRQGEMILHAGQSIRTEGRRLIPLLGAMAEDQQSFIRRMPASGATRPAEGYAALVISLKPVAYYRMEPPKTGNDRTVVLDEAGGGCNGVLAFSDQFNGSPYTEGRFGQSLRFRGTSTGDHVIVHDYPKAVDDELTVAAWVLATGRSPWPMIAANWGLRDSSGKYCSGQFFLGLSGQGEGLAAKITQRDGEIIALDEDVSRSFIPLGEWQHVALVIGRSSAHLFRNGIPVAAHSINGILRHPRMPSLGIGCRTNYLGSAVEWNEPCLWLGRIDELAVFNRALTVEEIRELSSFAGSPVRREGNRNAR